MNIHQIRNGRELAINLRLDLREFPDKFEVDGTGTKKSGAENKAVTYVQMKNTEDHIDLMQPEFEAVQAAKNYYHFRVKKWVSHR